MLKSLFHFREVLAQQEFPIDLYGPPRDILYGPPPLQPPSTTQITLTTAGIILGLAIPILGIIFFLKRKFLKHKNAPKNPQNRRS